MASKKKDEAKPLVKKTEPAVKKITAKASAAPVPPPPAVSKVKESAAKAKSEPPKPAPAKAKASAAPAAPAAPAKAPVASGAPAVKPPVAAKSAVKPASASTPKPAAKKTAPPKAEAKGPAASAEKTAKKPEAEKSAKAKKPAVAKKPAAAKPAAVPKPVAAKKPAAAKPAAASKPARKPAASKSKGKAAIPPAIVPESAVADRPTSGPLSPAPPSAPLAASMPPTFQRDLPLEYGDTKVVALVRDPEWVFLYWEIGSHRRAELGIPRGAHQRAMALRVYDVTDIHFDGTNAHSFYDVAVNDMAASWYLRVPEPSRAYIVDLGMYDADGDFVIIARSNAISSPPQGMSPQTDEQWMSVSEEQFAEIFRMSGGLRLREQAGSADVLRRPGEEIVQELRRQWVGSGMWSGASGSVTRPEKPRGFWLRVDCEVIIYGATEPDAHLTLQGKPIQLSPDGTFHARFAFPDGVIEMPVRATSADGAETREITPVVSRKTR